MALKSTFQAGDPLPAEDVNDIVKAVVQNEVNLFELFLENFFGDKVTPVNGMFFDGFSDSTKVDTISGIEVDASNRRLQFPLEAFGDGADGASTISSTVTLNNPNEEITSGAASGQKDVIVAAGGSFTVGKIVLIHQTQGTGAGNFEFRKIASIASNTLTMEENLSNTYAASGGQVYQPDNNTDITLNSGANVDEPNWDGTTGGIIVFLATGTVTINTGGKIDMKGSGFAKGLRAPSSDQQAFQGDSEVGVGAQSTSANGAGGGGGISNGSIGAGGGGAGHSVAGADGVEGAGTHGDGGSAVGNTALTLIFLGAGGGGASAGIGGDIGDGANGGGIVIIIASTIVISGGTILADGNTSVEVKLATGTSRGTGGGGAGGSILFLGENITLDTTKATSVKGGAAGCGAGTCGGGVGADGRIATNSDFDARTGTTNPTFNDNGGLNGLFGETLDLAGAYESIVTAFQNAKETIHLWITRNFPSQFNLAAGISIGATTLTITGDKTSEFANGDTIDISTDKNLIRERKTLTAVPTFGAGVTTLAFSATANAFTTSDFVERVDILPSISIVNSGAAKSFQTPIHQQSIVDFVNNEVEDEYLLTAVPPEEDLKIKIDITRNDSAKRPRAKRLGVVANE